MADVEAGAIRGREGLRRAALDIFAAGLRAVDPYAAVKRCLRLEGSHVVLETNDDQSLTYDMNRYRRVVIVGGGKASARMSEAVEEVLGDRVSDGLIVVKYGHAAQHRRVKVVEAGHPLPDAQGIESTRRLLGLLDAAGDDTLILSLISGGGSALLPAPAPGIGLAEKQALTGLLLTCGADIREINTVRKHISAIKGGQLARRALPATLVNLVLSDVVGDPIDMIASGPAYPDSSTFAEAKAVLDRYALWERTPEPICRRFEDGLAGRVPETPKLDDPAFARCSNVVIGSNIVALQACQRRAQAQGFNTLLLSSSIEGETRDVARMHAAIAQQIKRTGQPVAAPACIISGGETTVTLAGQGKGGRNQEFVLAVATDIAGYDGVAVFSAGTDGTDGPTDAAGAIAFGDSAARATAAAMRPEAFLRRNDAYTFFDTLGDLIKTGPTGTNVMDVHLVLVVDPT